MPELSLHERFVEDREIPTTRDMIFRVDDRIIHIDPPHSFTSQAAQSRIHDEEQQRGGYFVPFAQEQKTRLT